MKRIFFFLAFFFLLSPFVQAENCKKEWNFSSNTFLQPVDAFTNQALFSADCQEKNVEITIGENASDSTLYIWKKIYHTTDGVNLSENIFELEGKTDKTGKWIVGQGTAEISFSEGAQYVGAYMCRYVEKEWKCGCSSAEDCSNKSWFLQKIQVDSTVEETKNIPENLPTPQGECPEFLEGEEITFNGNRTARAWFGDTTKNGPLVLYFHGTGGNAMEALWAMEQENINRITALGGAVISANANTDTHYPWYHSMDGREDDFLLTDEMVACALQELGIDPAHIHSTGFSAGGVFTSDLALRRANYFASTAPISGGYIPSPPNQNSANQSAHIVFHGGAADMYEGVSFQEFSEDFADDINALGGFAVMCNHGEGHTIPRGMFAPAVDFFLTHPFNDLPSRYADGVPVDFSEYCSIYE